MSSNDDDFLEDRFGEFNQALLEEQIREHDLQKNDTLFDKQFALNQLSFSEKIPQKVIAILKQLIIAILEFSGKEGLSLRDPNHQVRFLDVSSYEQETQKTISPSVPLPASQLHFNSISRIYTVTVVLPDKIQSNEEVINVTRTLFSKFMGDIYLNEHVLSHDFYREANRYEEDEITVSIPDQLHAIAGNEFQSAMLEEACRELAKKFRMNYKKQRAAVMQSLKKEWMEQWENQKIKDEDLGRIDRIFQDYLEDFRSDPENGIIGLLKKIEKLNAQLHFLLPHETRAYRLFEEKSQTQYIQAASHKIEEIIAKIGLIEELATQLEEAQDPDDLILLFDQIQIQMHQMKKEGKVKIFLIPNVRMGPQLKAEEQKFPLRLIKYLPKTLPVQEWDKEIRQLEKKYSRSIYQKIFESLIYLKHWIGALMEHQEDLFLESDEHKKLKQLLHNFRFREPILQELLSTMGIALDYREVLKITPHRSVFPLQSFKKAWSYVCSSILIHRYYEHMNQLEGSQRRFNGEKYMAAIEKYLAQQLSRGVDYAPVAALFLLIYKQKKEEGLKYLLYLIHHPQASFQYALNQMLTPAPDSDSPEEKWRKLQEKLEKYQDFLIQVYDERVDSDILPGRDY
ncbi:MAG: hypothetical protein HQM13_22970 [SAR324 cluster bacterium]|nr:hypothetical protein [SAR324 cluster bacterium]